MKVVFGKGFTRRGKQHLNSSFILTKDFEGKRNANSDANRLRSTQNENDRNNDGVDSNSKTGIKPSECDATSMRGDRARERRMRRYSALSRAEVQPLR